MLLLVIGVKGNVFGKGNISKLGFPIRRDVKIVKELSVNLISNVIKVSMLVS